MAPILTERLTLRPFTEADIPALHEWCSDPRVMSYVPSGPDATLEDTARRMAYYLDHQARHGFSKWAVVRSGELIGDAGLLVQPGWVDLGFRLAAPHWGHGYATEAGSAWVRAAGELGLSEKLGAFTHPGNLASQRVLVKLGFLPVREEVVRGMPARVYRLATINHREA